MAEQLFFAAAPIVVASHPRSGTHLLIDLLRLQFDACAMKKRMFSWSDACYINLDEILSIPEPAGAREIRDFNKARKSILKTHRLPNFFERYQFLSPVTNERKDLCRLVQSRSIRLYVYRNVKDVMRSLYYFVPEADRGASISAFIRQVRGKRQLSRIGFWANHVAEWLKQDSALVLNYDSILRSPREQLIRIGLHIDEQPLMRQPFLPTPPSSLFEQRLKTFISKKPASTAVMSFGGKGKKEMCAKEDDEYIWGEVMSVAPELVEKGILV